jgi:APA family basic amino acid/polyamine antiporter
VIGSVIGSGIFIVPSLMIKILPSPELLLLVWVFSAAISITGGLVVAGMGLAYPNAKDLIDYFRSLYPRWLHWSFSQIFIWIISCCGTVAVTFVFAEYLGYFIQMDQTQTKIAAIILTLLLGTLGITNTKAADRFQVVFTGAKVGALFLIIALLILPGKGNLENFEMSHTENWSTFQFIAAFVAACTGALSALDGWYIIGHITPEVKGGIYTVKKAIIWGLLLCTSLYLLTAFAYQYVLTPEEIGASHLVAVRALEKELGGVAPKVIAVLVLISSSSCVNANLIATSRLIASAAEQKTIPSYFAKRSSANIPVQAFILMLIVECIMIVSGSYELFLNLTIHAVWTFITLLTAGFLYVYLKNNLQLPGYKRIPLVIACSTLILFGIVFLISAFI